MFDGLFVHEPTPTEKEILSLQEERKQYNPASEEYAKINQQIKLLIEMKQMEAKKGFSVSGDTVVKCLFFGAVCTLMIFKEELVGPIASKALSVATKIM